MVGDSWLVVVMGEAESEARRRGDERLSPDHVGLALTRPGFLPATLVARLGFDPLEWRDQVNTVLGWQEGARAAREGRPAGRGADSPSQLRFDGKLEVDPGLTDVLDIARDEAAADGTVIGAAHLLVGLVEEGQSVAAATARWLGVTPGQTRRAAGLRVERRTVAEGHVAVPAPRPIGSWPVVLSGGGTDQALLADLLGLVTTCDPACSAPRALNTLGGFGDREREHDAPLIGFAPGGGS